MIYNFKYVRVYWNNKISFNQKGAQLISIMAVRKLLGAVNIYNIKIEIKNRVI